MRIGKLCCIVVFCLAFTAGASIAAELHVPADYPTIQSAIDAAADGDSVIVSPGRYVEHINFLGKAITVRSSDPDSQEIVAATIIDGDGTGRCVTFDHDEGHDSVIQGFTITNGCAPTGDSDGAGIYCVGASPVIDRNVVCGNVGASAVYATVGSPLIVDTTVSANEGWGVVCIGPGTVSRNNVSGNKNGLYASGVNGIATAVANTICDNHHGSDVGGVALGRCVFLDNYVAGNSSDWGAGIRAADSTIAGNIIEGNNASTWGGGVMVKANWALITANIVVANRAGVGLGAGVDVSTEGTVVMMGNLIAANQGHGLDCSSLMSLAGSCVTLANNTVVGNHGGLGIGRGRVVVRNCAVRDNRVELAAGWSEELPSIPVPAEVTVEHSLISGGLSGLNLSSEATLTWGPGNIDADPVFLDPGRWDDAGTPENTRDDTFILGDYHLLPGSPCIDAGTDNVDDPDTEEVEVLPDTDLDGKRRIIDGDLDGTATVDIGAYEYLPGDVNYDGRVNILDMLLVRNVIGNYPVSDATARACDVNADGEVNLADLLAVRARLGSR